jgi:hypothetical protein
VKKTKIVEKLEFWSNLFYHLEKSESFFMFAIEKKDLSSKKIQTSIKTLKNNNNNNKIKTKFKSSLLNNMFKFKKPCSVIEFLMIKLIYNNWYTEKGQIFINFAENMIFKKKFELGELKYPQNELNTRNHNKNLGNLKAKLLLRKKKKSLKFKQHFYKSFTKNYEVPEKKIKRSKSNNF